MSAAIRGNGGYQLMPEWSTQPANHCLPRKHTRIKIHSDELGRSDNPRKRDTQLPKPGPTGPTIEDAVGC